MLTANQLAAYERHAETVYACAIHGPDSPVVAVAGAIVRALAAAVPAPASAIVGPAIDGVMGRAAHVSVTIPTPLGTLILLSSQAVSTPLSRFRTVAHEAVHASQIQQHGGVQTAVDWIGSTELRAVRETHACITATWAEYLVTGVLPVDPVEVVRSLEGHTYQLDAGDVDLARDIAASSLLSMRAGVCPPVEVCAGLLAWMREHAPEAIKAEAFRA